MTLEFAAYALTWGWTLIALAGVIVSSYVYFEARADARARRQLNQNGTLALTARLILREAAAFAGVFLLLFIGGSLVLTEYKPPVPSQLALAVEVRSTFDVLELVLLWVKVQNYRDRKRIRGGRH